MLEFGCVGAEIKWDKVLWFCGLWFCGLLRKIRLTQLWVELSWVVAIFLQHTYTVHHLIRTARVSSTWMDLLASSPGSRSSQSARGSGNSFMRTPKEESWSVSTEEGEAREWIVSASET